MTYTYKNIIDSDGITYEEVSYDEYLKSKNKHRIVQSLESRYFVEVDKDTSSTKECNCGGIKGEDWSHETWCNLSTERNKEIAKEKT